MDFTRICRICLHSNKQYCDMFKNYYTKKNISYSDMMSTCTRVKPCEDDGLPRLICKDCSRQLKRTYIFNTQCEESDKKLRYYLHKHEIEINILPNIIDKDSDVKIEDFEDEEYKINVTKTNNEHTSEDTFLDPILQDEAKIKSDIKSEPNLIDEEDNSCWDADEDNLVLGELKLKKKIAGNFVVQDLNQEKPKKKRGRKKKEYVDGGVPSVPESKLPHQCDICGKFLSTKSNLKAHKICHTDLRPYKCSECPASFRGHSALFQHKKVHTGETPYHCEYCPKQFSRRTGLVNHIRMHTGEKHYSCDICFKTFVQSAQLSIHMKRHKGDKPFLCQDCGKGFPIKADLKVHQRIHNGEKPYSCHLCTKTFATSGNLSIHVRIHNKEIRYNCKECHRGFVTCSAYNVHLKRHKGQRDYNCECGKTFYTSSALKQHKVVHTGEKKYQCKICERKFTQTSHLSRHFKRDHAKPNVPVPPSDYYKLVLQETGKSIFGIIDEQKLQHVNSGVKCEAS